MNKSGILKKSIDKIRSLEVENIELRLENQRLRQMLDAHTMPEIFEAPLSPPISDSSSPRPQAIKSQSIESDQKILFIQRGVSPHAKFALCMFMFSIISLNSFGSLIALNDRPNSAWSEGNTAATARRTILSTVIDDVRPIAHHSPLCIFLTRFHRLHPECDRIEINLVFFPFHLFHYLPPHIAI